MERILVRLAADPPGTWVLKGGMALELRLPDRARVTRDLDLSARDAIADDGDLTVRLRDLLAMDTEGDRFTFDVTSTRRMEPAVPEPPMWRLLLSARLAGRTFVDLHADVSPRAASAEVVATERLPVPNSLEFDGFPPHEFETVTAAQHFAETVHALTRDYGRENSRTRDLVDLVLLIDEGLVTPTSVMPAVRVVFGARGTHPVPLELADPPIAWADPFTRMATEVGLGERTVDAAMAMVRTFWAQALDQAART